MTHFNTFAIMDPMETAMSQLNSEESYEFLNKHRQKGSEETFTRVISTKSFDILFNRLFTHSPPQHTFK